MGAAAPGMGRELTGLAAARAVLEEFSSASDTDIAHLVTEAGPDELYADRAWELAIVSTEVAATHAYRAAGGVVSGALGFSIGAYASLHSAGMLTVRQIVMMIDLVLDASLELEGRYAMAAITGPTVGKIEGLCRPGSVEICSVLCPGQALVAGRAEAVAELGERIAPVAVRVTPLEVRWPLHTTMMGAVAERLERSRPGLGGLLPLRHPVYSGIDGSRIADPAKGWELLVQHLVRPQRFDLALPAAVADGFGRVVELGPGATLARAAARVGVGAAAVESFSGFGDSPRRRAGRPC